MHCTTEHTVLQSDCAIARGPAKKENPYGRATLRDCTQSCNLSAQLHTVRQSNCSIARSPAIKENLYGTALLRDCTQSCDLTAQLHTVLQSNCSYPSPPTKWVPDPSTPSWIQCQTPRHSSARVPDTQTLKCQTLRHWTGFSADNPWPDKALLLMVTKGLIQDRASARTQDTPVPECKHSNTQ